jgi:hypothetical protein
VCRLNPVPTMQEREGGGGVRASAHVCGERAGGCPMHASSPPVRAAGARRARGGPRAAGPGRRATARPRGGCVGVARRSCTGSILLCTMPRAHLSRIRKLMFFSHNTHAHTSHAHILTPIKHPHPHDPTHDLRVPPPETPGRGAGARNQPQADATPGTGTGAYCSISLLSVLPYAAMQAKRAM